MELTATLPQKPAVATTMRAAVLTAPGKIEIRDNIELREPGPKEVRIRMETCGVCASNLSPWEGKPWFSYPFEPGAPGHEGTGYVDAIGANVVGLEIGSRCAVLSYHAYAEYDYAPADAVVPLPPELDDQPFLGEPLGCAMNIFRRAFIDDGETVAIVGVGFLGSLLIQLAASAGARVFAIARRPYAQEVARAMGAAEVIAMDDHNRIIEKIKDATDGKLCDVTIEAVGAQWPLDLAAEITGERGRLVIAGYHQDGPRQVNMQLWNWRGLDVINAHEREPQIYIRGIRDAIRAVQNGQLTPKPLCTHSFPLERLGEALELTRKRPHGFMKAMIHF